MIVSEETRKVCSRCGEPKPPTDFTLHRASRDGLNAACRDCTRAAGAASYARHREKSRERIARYRERRPEVARAAQRRWRERHPDRARAAYDTWYAANVERERERARDKGRRRRAVSEGQADPGKRGFALVSWESPANGAMYRAVPVGQPTRAGETVVCRYWWAGEEWKKQS